jgi:hypothetical protein
VSYYRDGDCLWVITTRSRTWWKNLRGGAEVSLLFKRKPVTAFAETECDEKAVAAHLVEYLRHIPQAAKSLGVRIENNNVNEEDALRVAKERLFVRFKPIVSNL